MKRFFEKILITWMQKPQRKPLLVSGVRQVGKTWSITDFGRKYFDDFLYVNFDAEPAICDIFRKSKDPERILFELSILSGKSVKPEHTLIFFDEIQECNEALNSLKYFCESERDYYVIGAGSYLGVTLSQGFSFPVGKVEMLEMKPMSFKEFLLASDQGILVDFIESIDEISPISQPLFEKLNRFLMEYYLAGGMPEAVKTWTASRDLAALDAVQTNIINAYYRDFSKYPPKELIPKIISIWDSIIAQLSKENRKFKYSEIHKNARSREYEQALNWLIAGNYLYCINKVSAFQLPLKSYENLAHFKVYMPDTGLLRNRAQFPISSLLEPKKNDHIPFKGALVENYVLQELRSVFKRDIFYWSKNNYELDFLLQDDGLILPIEVKAGMNVSSKSMTKVLSQLEVGLRFSMRNLSYDGSIINIPLPLVSEFQRLISTF